MRSLRACFLGVSFTPLELRDALRRNLERLGRGSDGARRGEVDREGKADRQHQPDNRGKHISQRAHASTVATAFFRNGKTTVNDHSRADQRPPRRVPALRAARPPHPSARPARRRWPGRDLVLARFDDRSTPGRSGRRRGRARSPGSLARRRGRRARRGSRGRFAATVMRPRRAVAQCVLDEIVSEDVRQVAGIGKDARGLALADIDRFAYLGGRPATVPRRPPATSARSPSSPSASASRRAPARAGPRRAPRADRLRLPPSPHSPRPPASPRMASSLSFNPVNGVRS